MAENGADSDECRTQTASDMLEAARRATPRLGRAVVGVHGSKNATQSKSTLSSIVEKLRLGKEPLTSREMRILNSTYAFQVSANEVDVRPHQRPVRYVVEDERGTNRLYAILDDGTRRNFSYRSASVNLRKEQLAFKRGGEDEVEEIKNKIKRDRRLKAFRKEVEDKSEEVRTKAYFKLRSKPPERVVCGISGKELKPEDFDRRIHIHHDPEFTETLEQWLDSEGIEITEIPLKDADGGGNKLEDGVLAGKWISFHNENFELVPVLKDEHDRHHAERRRKGKKAD